MLDPQVKALLPEIIKNTMDTLSELTNAPDEMTLPVTLAAANFAAQAITDVDPIAWRKAALSEFFCVIVPSGGMKTSVSDYVLDGLRDYEKQEELNYSKAMTQYKIAMKQYKTAIEEEAKNPTGKLIEEPEKPKGIRYKVEKATVNGLINTLDSVPFAGLFNSDGGEFFNSHSFQKQENALEMVTMLSKAWSGEMIDRVTGIEENNVRLHNRRFNMLVMLQKEMAGFLRNSQYKDQGFTNRMLITQCGLFDKPVGDFSAANQAKIKALQAQLHPFNDRVLKLLNKVDALQDKARMAPLPMPGMSAMQIIQSKLGVGKAETAKPNELLLDTIKFDVEDGASKIMEDFYNEMRAAVNDKKYSEYVNFISRAYEHACRIAATLAVFDLKDVINAQYAAAGVALMHYFIEQRLNLEIDGSVKANTTVEVSEDVKRWIKRQTRDGVQGVSKQDLAQAGPSSYRKLDKEQKKAVLVNLEDNGDIEIEEVAIEGKKSKFLIKVVCEVAG